MNDPMVKKCPYCGNERIIGYLDIQTDGKYANLRWESRDQIQIETENLFGEKITKQKKIRFPQLVRYAKPLERLIVSNDEIGTAAWYCETCRKIYTEFEV